MEHKTYGLDYYDARGKRVGVGAASLGCSSPTSCRHVRRDRCQPTLAAGPAGSMRRTRPRDGRIGVQMERPPGEDALTCALDPERRGRGSAGAVSADTRAG